MNAEEMELAIRRAAARALDHYVRQVGARRVLEEARSGDDTDPWGLFSLDDPC